MFVKRVSVLTAYMGVNLIKVRGGANIYQLQPEELQSFRKSDSPLWKYLLSCGSSTRTISRACAYANKISRSERACKAMITTRIDTAGIKVKEAETYKTCPEVRVRQLRGSEQDPSRR